MPVVKVRYRGRIVNLRTERVTLPNGVTTELEIIGHPGGAAAAAVNDRGEICLLHQYRHAVSGWLWELPAGRIEAGEPPVDTARRELAEEAGVGARTWQPLGVMVSSPGVFTERVHLFLATGLEPAVIDREADEVLEVHWVPLSRAYRAALDGAVAGLPISDAKSALGIVRAAATLGVVGE